MPSSLSPSLQLGSRPAFQGLEAASYVTCLQKETLGIAMAAEGFMMMPGLGFETEHLRVVEMLGGVHAFLPLLTKMENSAV